jgi:hypothetical protein
MCLLYLSKFRKEICNVLFGRFFVHIRNQNNPAFDCYRRQLPFPLMGEEALHRTAVAWPELAENEVFPLRELS